MINPMQIAWVPTLLVALAVTVLAGSSYYIIKTQTQSPKSCTLEAKVCPDGSSVGRVGPNCEFAPCPTTDPIKGADCELQKGQNLSDNFVKGEVLVLFKEGVSLEEAGQVVKSFGLTIEDAGSFNFIRSLLVKVPEGEEQMWICKVSSNPQVKSAEPNNIIQIPDCSKGPC